MDLLLDMFNIHSYYDYVYMIKYISIYDIDCIMDITYCVLKKYYKDYFYVEDYEFINDAFNKYIKKYYNVKNINIKLFVNNFDTKLSLDENIKKLI